MSGHDSHGSASGRDVYQAAWRRFLRHLTAKPPEYVVEVSPTTLAQLKQIARRLDCNVEAALEEVIREFNLP